MPGKTLTLPECKDYMKTIIELEMRIPQLEKLHHELFDRRTKTIKERQRYEGYLEEETPKKVGIGEALVEAIGVSVMAAAIGAAGGAAVGVVIGLFKWIFDGKWLWEKSLRDLVLVAKQPLLKGLLFGALILGVLFFFYYLWDKTSTSRTDIWRHERNVKEATEKLPEVREREVFASERYDECDRQLTMAKDLLDRYYKMGFIYPKYCGLVPVSTLYEYLISGRCQTLLGPSGAYNLYENELRMGLILEKLDEIIDRLDDIDYNQRMLAQQIKHNNEQINRVCKSLDRIEENTALTQYYSGITAANTSYLSWLAFMES